MRKLNTAPAFKIAVLFSTGILIGAYFEFNLILLLILSLLLISFIFYFTKNNSSEISLWILIYFSIIIFGITKSSYDFRFKLDNSIAKFPETERNKEIKLCGIAEELPDIDSTKIRILLSAKQIIEYNNGKYDSTNVDGHLIAYIRKNKKFENDTLPFKITAGDDVSLYGKLSESGNDRNPGEFDYKTYLKLHNIEKVFYAEGFDNLELNSRNNLNFFNQNVFFPARNFSNHSIDSLIGGDEGAFLKGLVTGERSDITKEIKEEFVKAGVMHLIAVSGLNVAYIIISVSLVLLLLRIPKIPRTFITIGVIIFYCFFTGAAASIVRASVMGILFLLSFIIQRKTNFYNTLGLSALVILFYDSKQLFDPGFILSYSATISMVFFYNRFEELFLVKMEKWRSGYRKYIIYILSLLFLTFAAQLGTIPLTALYFGKISFVSFIVNLIAVPLSNLSLAIGFFQIVMALLSNYVASVIAETNSFLLSIQLYIIKWFASLKYAYIEFYKFDLVNTIGYFVFIISLFTSLIKKFTSRIVFALLIIIAIFLFNFSFEKNLRITFIDVGEAECTLIQTPEGYNIMIDCGTENSAYNKSETVIEPYLKREGINKIDLLILSHPHIDHIGGISSLIKRFNIKKIIKNNSDYKIFNRHQIDSIIVFNQIELENVTAGDMIEGIGNLKIYFLNPFKSNYETGNTEIHQNTLVAKVKYINTEILFTGDIETETEEMLSLIYKNFLKSNILKVSHHGSKNASCSNFLKFVNPEYSVIFSSPHNNLHHPGDATIGRLTESGTKICRTDKEGAVIFETDGNYLSKINWR